jgi:lipoprotein NlpI
MAYSGRGAAYEAKGEYGRAIQDFNEAIRLNPSSSSAYRSRGLANFNSGAYLPAQTDFKKSLDLEPSDPFGAIWLYLASAHLGQDAKQELARDNPKLKHVRITEQIVSMFLGKLSPRDLLAAAQDLDPKKQKENLCEATFYAGQYALLRGNKAEALKFFRETLETGVTDFVEYTAAKTEISSLEKSR